MAFAFYIQTDETIKSLSQNHHKARLWRILKTWEPIANFPDHERSISISFVDDQPDYSIKVMIPFLGPPGEETDVDAEGHIHRTFGIDLQMFGYILASPLLKEDKHSVPAPGVNRAFYRYNLDYLPHHPLYDVAKTTDELFDKVNRIHSQIGSHTNHVVMEMIKLELNELIRDYNTLLKNPLKVKLKNWKNLEEAFKSTREKYQAQKNRLIQYPCLNQMADPVTNLPPDMVHKIICFLSLQDIHVLLFLVSKKTWNTTIDIGLTFLLASQVSQPTILRPDNYAKSKQTHISLIQSLPHDLKIYTLLQSKLWLDVAEKLTKLGFERFHPHIQSDIARHPAEVNELMTRDPRYCLFFAKLVTSINHPHSSVVEWAYAEKENIAKLLKAEPRFPELVLSRRMTHLTTLLIVEKADLLLDDLKKIGLGLGDFLQNKELCALFLKSFLSSQIAITAPDPEGWRNYVEEHTQPEKTASPAP